MMIKTITKLTPPQTETKETIYKVDTQFGMKHLTRRAVTKNMASKYEEHGQIINNIENMIRDYRLQFADEVFEE